MGKIGVFFLKLISSLPFWLLYRLSDFLYLVLYKVMGYRTKVVRTNLENSFPEKSPKEIQKIMDEFYSFLCDLILESIKCFTMSTDELAKRMTLHLSDEFKESAKNDQNAIFVLGHFANWEYAQLRFSMIEERQNFVGVYKKVGSKDVDQFLYKVRGRTGTDLTEMKQVSRRVQECVNEHIPFIIALVSDQSPSKERGYWMEFLNQDTPVFLGAERYAQKLDAPIFFVDLRRKKRGFYEMHVVPLIMEPQKMAPGEITEIHTKHLESIIKQQPELWLWSHKRWKHKRPEGLPETQLSKRYVVKK